MALVKAKIRNLDTNESVTCLFNPTEYTFAKEVGWAEAQERGADVPNLEFTGGKPATLSLKLFFDTSADGADVRSRYTNALMKLALVNKAKLDSKTNKGRPPRVMFEWGNSWSFEAVVTSLNQSFTMFLEDGTPTRATVDLTLRQSLSPDDFPAQNPTSSGAAGVRTRVVQQRETLDLIAFEEYGNAQHWRHIAEANRIDNPMAVRPGMVLSLPPLGRG